ncbi:MAG: dihydroneopterin aldolase [Candidatus Kariarchaeaceae archaeon]
MSDRIIIRDLLVRGIVGINEWERVEKQDILINMTIYSSLDKAGESDDIEDTINYRTLTKAIISYIELSEHFLVEALASEIARIVLVDFNADRIILRVEKPGALRYAKSVGIEIERSRQDFND